MITRSFLIVFIATAPLSLASLLGYHWGDVSFFAAGMLLYYAILYGLWLFTSPNPVTTTVESRSAVRRVVRHTIVASAVTASFATALGMTNPGGRTMQAIIMLGAPFGLIGVVGAVALCSYSASLARNVGDSFALGRTRLFAYGYVLAWMLLEPAMALVLFSNNALGACLFLPGIAGVLGFGVLILNLPSYLDKRIEQQLKRAHEVYDAAMQDLEHEGPFWRRSR